MICASRLSSKKSHYRMPTRDGLPRFGLKYPIYKIRNNAYHYLAALRRMYLRSVYGMTIGENTRISRTARLDKTNPRGVIIGSGTSVSFEASILTHDFVNRRHLSTQIGDNCFIGARSIILPGVRIGDSCIVGAGSVVMSNVPSNTIVSGNPARAVNSGVKTGEYGILMGQDAAVLAPTATAATSRATWKASRRDILDFVQSETGVDDASMDIDVADTKVDSFALITLRAALEAKFGVVIPDNEWLEAKALSKIAELPTLSALETQPPAVKKPSSPNEGRVQEVVTMDRSKFADPPAEMPSIPDDRFTDVTHKLPSGKPAPMVDNRSPGAIERRLMLEMSKMALSGLGEPWLFRELNDLHWTLICDYLETPSSQVTDGLGDRLYATITRCQIEFPGSLSAFAENSPLNIGSQLQRYGASIFFSESAFEGTEGNNGTARMMSTFAKYGERGNNKSLIKGSPTLPEIDTIPHLETIPDFCAEYRERRSEDADPEVIYETEYEILSPHDINGVGLLYFAAYPMIFDLCLEQFEGKGFLQAFSTVSKDLYYYSNSEPSETLIFRVHRREELGGGLLEHTCSLSRKSDGVRMAELVGQKRSMKEARTAS